jgi:photosystem II stability/assembly factor-like uncharacterized protein
MRRGPLVRAAARGLLLSGLLGAPLGPSAAPLLGQAAGATARDDSLIHIRFRSLGPTVAGGRVTAVAGIPGVPNVYYIGAAAGGVWKTTDGGISWTPIFEHERTASIGAIALAPSNPNVVWVGTGEANIRNDVVTGRGIYRSTDAGRSWRFMGLADAGQIARIVIDPSNPDRVVVAALGRPWAPNAERGIFRTTDGGRTWRKVLFVNDTTGAADLALQPGNPNVLFAAMWQVRRFPWELVDGGPGSGLYRSVDGGETWTKLTNGLPAGPYGRSAIAIARSEPTHVYALIEAKTGMLWESRDLGDHWTAVNASHALNVRPFYFSVLTVAPDDDRRLYFSSFHLMQSDDGGRTARVIDPDVHPDHHALWIDPEDPARMIQGNDGGVYLSTDAGRSWRFLNTLPIGQFYTVAADRRTPYHLCGGLQDNGAWCGPSNTLDPEGGTGAEWQMAAGGDGEYAVPAPSDSTVLYVDSQNGAIRRVDLRSGTARFIRPSLESVQDRSPAELAYRFNWTAPIAVSPTNANEVYLGANVLFKSTDGGARWTVISPDVTRNDKRKQRTSGGPVQLDVSGAETYNTILSIALAPTDPRVIWLGTDDGNVVVTRDGGRTWTNVRPRIKDVPEEGRVYQVGISPFDAGTAYITIDRHMLDDDRPYVFKTTDYGESWASISAGLPADAPAHVVREDPHRRNVLVLGTDTGLWWSRDGGATWTSLASAVPTVPVFDLTFVPDTRALVVATHGRGLLVLDDLTPLEELTPEVESEAVHLMTVEPAMLWARDRLERAPASAYRAPNPPLGAVIHYFLREALDSSDSGQGTRRAPVRLTITSPRGDTVYTASGPARRGVNRIVWRLTYSGPTALSFGPRPAEEEPREAELPGPRVLPGTYFVTLEAAGHAVSRPVVVRPDPRLPFDSAAARAQLAAGLALRNAISALDEMLNGLHLLRAQIRTLEATLRAAAPGHLAADSTVRRAAEGLDAKLRALMDTVYNPAVQRDVPEDEIHYLDRLYERLTGLRAIVWRPYAQAPGEPARTRLAAVRRELEAALARYNDLVRTDVAAFNRVAAAHGAPVLLTGGPVMVR